MRLDGDASAMRAAEEIVTRRFTVTWFCVALTVGLTVNELNLHYVKAFNPSNVTANSRSTLYGYAIWSIDSSSYTTQIKNLVAGHGFTLHPADPSLMIRRTPFYPLFYGLHYALFGEKRSYQLIRYTQLVIHAVSVVLLGWGVLHFTGNALWARATVALYAFCPFTAVYAYFVLTEALFPFLAILCFYCLSRGVATDGKGLFVAAGIVAACLALTRPVAGLILPSILLYLIVDHCHSRRSSGLLAAKCALVLSGFALAMAPWVIRNYIVTNGRIVLLDNHFGGEFNYDPNIPHGLKRYGRGHTYFRKWWSCWDNPDAERYAATILSVLSGDNPRRQRDKTDDFLSTLPAHAFSGSRRAEVRDALIALNQCYAEKLSNRSATAFVDVPACEAEVTSRFENLIAQFKRANPIQYYVITPFRLAWKFAFHSFSAAFGSLSPSDRGPSRIQVALKAAFYLLNLSLYIAFVYSIVSRQIPVPFRALLLFFPLLQVLFYAGVNRYIEGRYLLAAYPFFYIGLARMSIAAVDCLRSLKRSGGELQQTGPLTSESAVR